MNTYVIKNALSPMLANAVVAEFPDENWRHWHKYNDVNSLKYASKDAIRFPSSIKRALNELGGIIEQSEICLQYPKSFIDYEFHAAGLHMIPSGGHLGKHKDAARHPIMPWKRTLSACWYATPNWQEEWGGEIDIEDGGTLLPEFNMLAIFESNRWHEVMPVTGPEHRRVLSLFCWEIDNNASGMTQAEFQK